jgi:hypothetical protein
MNEKEIGKLLQEGVFSPSDDFSNELMRKINAESASLKSSQWIPMFLSAACVLLFILLALISSPDISLFSKSLPLPPVVIQILGICFLLYEATQIRELRKNQMLMKR